MYTEQSMRYHNIWVINSAYSTLTMNIQKKCIYLKKAASCQYQSFSLLTYMLPTLLSNQVSITN